MSTNLSEIIALSSNPLPTNGSGSSAINNQTGTAYTLTTTDNNDVIVLTNSAPITLTLPNNLPAGFNCLIIQAGAGQVTLTPATGATLVSRQGYTKLAGQNASGSLIVTANGSGTAASYNFSGDGI